MKNSADDDVSTLEAYETLITNFELADLLGKIVHVEKEVKAKPQTTATSNVNEVYAKILTKIIASMLDENVCDSATINKYCVEVKELALKTVFRNVFVGQYVKHRLLEPTDLSKYFTASEKVTFQTLDGPSRKCSIRDNATKAFNKITRKTPAFDAAVNVELKRNVKIIKLLEIPFKKTHDKLVEPTGSSVACTVDAAVSTLATDSLAAAPAGFETVSRGPPPARISLDDMDVTASRIVDLFVAAPKSQLSLDTPPSCMITSNTSEYVPGEIIIYIFSCCDHVKHHLEEHYRLLLKLEDSEVRQDLINSCNKIFEDGILMKIGYYAEEFKNVSTIIIFYC